MTNYLTALDRLMLIEPLDAWQPHMRSRTRLRTTPVHHFVDPSLGVGALGVGVQDLLADLNAAGFHFESLALRDLRIYAQALGVRFSSWRDTKLNHEVDAVLELPNAEIGCACRPLAVSAGANVKAVQRTLGHASTAMNLDLYADLSTMILEAVADAHDRLATESVVVKT